MAGEVPSYGGIRWAKHNGAPPYLGHVVKLDEDAITFKDVDSTKIKPAVDFAGAEVRLHQYDPAYSKAAFTALWENGLQCILTEMLGDSPNNLKELL